MESQAHGKLLAIIGPSLQNVLGIKPASFSSHLVGFYDPKSPIFGKISFGGSWKKKLGKLYIFLLGFLTQKNNV